MEVREEKGRRRRRRRRRRDRGERRVREVGDWWMGGISDIPGFCALRFLLILLHCGGTSSSSSLYTFHPSTPRHSCPIITISFSSTSQLRGTMSLFSSFLGLITLLFTRSLIPHSQVALDLAVDVCTYEGPLVWFLTQQFRQLLYHFIYTL